MEKAIICELIQQLELKKSNVRTDRADICVCKETSTHFHMFSLACYGNGEVILVGVSIKPIVLTSTFDNLRTYIDDRTAPPLIKEKYRKDKSCSFVIIISSYQYLQNCI